MAGTLNTTAGGLWGEQPAGATETWTLDWSADGTPSGPGSWTVAPVTSPPLATSNAAASGTSTSVTLSGGAPGTWYSVTNTVTLPGGRTGVRSFMLLLNAGAPAAGASALFPFPPAAVAAVRRSRLSQLAKSYLGGKEFGDDEIWSKLINAEAEAERELRVWLTPREVLPSHPSYDDEAAAFVTQGKRVARDPGYDWGPGMFGRDRWGIFEMRHQPITRIHWARYMHPNPDQAGSSVDIPADWFRLDGKTNRVQIVPTTTPSMAPLAGLYVGMMGAGRTIPYLLQIAYRAGLEDWRERFPDIADVVLRMATLTFVEDTLLPSSYSVSGDGLSQSISFEADKHREIIKEKLGKMRDQAQGIRFIVA